MNKKLFSWKALAGLALLVAVGLTSCKQGTEVDPNDPYNTKTPTQPGTSTKGGDLVFTITKTADLASLWASYDATKKAELMKKTTLNIVINSGSYKLDGAVLTLPKFFNTTANSVLNITFNGNFQDADKQPLNLDASTNLSGAKVNITLPAQTFNMGLDATNVAATLTSAGATIGTFAAAANANKNNALTIGSGVTIKGISDASTGAIVKGGGDIVALIVNGAPTYTTKKGFAVGSELNVTNLIINTTGLTITNDADTPLGDITINKNCDLKLGFKNATVKSITGTKASESKVTLSGDFDDLKNIGAIKNVTLSNNGSGLKVTKDIFDGVKITEMLDCYSTSLSNVEVDNRVWVSYDADNKSFSFANVAFTYTAATATTPASQGFIRIWGGIEKKLTPTKVTYQWDINNNKWVEVTAAAPITAANASDTGIEVSSNDVSFWDASAGAFNYSKIQKGADKVGDHKVFTIVSENTNYILPENCSLNLDAKCTYNGTAINDANINNAITSSSDDPTYVTVFVGNDKYTFKKANTGYLLVK
jgi:hypothetical protein